MSVRILVVEDESIIQLDLLHQLRRLGYSVVGSAASGEEAVVKAAELMPDLVLMDVSLAGQMDGIEAAAQIRAARTVPILFLTAHHTRAREQQEAASNPYLAKPFRSVDLHTAIRQVLRDSGPDHSSGAEQPQSRPDDPAQGRRNCDMRPEGEEQAG
jgi:CheY-like chemotaxis protein